MTDAPVVVLSAEMFEMPAASEPLPLRLGALGKLKSLLEVGDWPDLRLALGELEVWVFDRPLAAAEGVDALEALLAKAEDRRLLVMTLLKEERHGELFQASFTCCLMWGEPETWQEHEIELDLHLGYTGNEDDWCLRYLGITAPTPEEIPFPEDHARSPRGHVVTAPILIPVAIGRAHGGEEAL